MNDQNGRGNSSFSLFGGGPSNLASNLPLGHPTEPPRTGEDMKNWQDGLKRLLPNVPIRFSPNINSESSLSQRQSLGVAPLNGFNRNNQQQPPPNDIFRQLTQSNNLQRGD